MMPLHYLHMGGSVIHQARMTDCLFDKKYGERVDHSFNRL
jgi:hypothetical protein